MTFFGLKSRGINNKTLPSPQNFDSTEEVKDIIHFLLNKLAALEERLSQNSRNPSVPYLHLNNLRIVKSEHFSQQEKARDSTRVSSSSPTQEVKEKLASLAQVIDSLVSRITDNF
nr:DUF6444 domain-containing protein [Vibrio sp. ES.051]